MIRRLRERKTEVMKNGRTKKTVIKMRNGSLTVRKVMNREKRSRRRQRSQG